MTLSPALARLLTSSVTLSTMTGMDPYGAATYGTAKTYKARIENTQRYIKTAGGRELLSIATVYVGRTSTGGYPPSGLAPTGKIVLPDGTSPGILKVDQNQDADGTNHHTVVYCG